MFGVREHAYDPTGLPWLNVTQVKWQSPESKEDFSN
jgi:hypothetical protein